MEKTYWAIATLLIQMESTIIDCADKRATIRSLLLSVARNTSNLLGTPQAQGVPLLNPSAFD
jgi:hypothetical protein